MISCEFTFIPLMDMEPEEKIMKILELIEKSGLDYTVGEMSSRVWGESEKVFQLFQSIDSYCREIGLKYHIQMIFSNYCACGM